MTMVFRIMDNDPERGRKAERDLRAAMKTYGVEGQVCHVLETLEFARIGLRNLPALEVGGKLFFQGQALSPPLLDGFCRTMTTARQAIENRGKETSANQPRKGKPCP
jgi:hypothetical protein